MPNWIIVKASRKMPRHPTAANAYKGPTARLAGVESAKIYDTHEAAQKDAVKLASWNRAGFIVIEVEE